MNIRILGETQKGISTKKKGIGCYEKGTESKIES